MTPLGLMVLIGLGAPASEAPAITKLIKKAERSAFEEHEAAPYLKIWDPKATYTKGRDKVPGPHDVTMSFEAFAEHQRLRYKEPPNGRSRIYFHREEATPKGDEAVFTAELARTFFGGSDSMRRHYTLKKTPAGWRITSLREWPVAEKFAGEAVSYDKAYWKAADERVKETPEAEPVPRTMVLVKAWRFQEAYELAVRRTQKTKTDPLAWISRAEMAIALGELADARKAYEAARKLDPNQDPPPLLKSLYPKRR